MKVIFVVSWLEKKWAGGPKLQPKTPDERYVLDMFLGGVVQSSHSLFVDLSD